MNFELKVQNYKAVNPSKSANNAINALIPNVKNRNANKLGIIYRVYGNVVPQLPKTNVSRTTLPEVWNNKQPVTQASANIKQPVTQASANIKKALRPLTRLTKTNANLQKQQIAAGLVAVISGAVKSPVKQLSPPGSEPVQNARFDHIGFLMWLGQPVAHLYKRKSDGREAVHVKNVGFVGGWNGWKVENGTLVYQGAIKPQTGIAAAIVGAISGVIPKAADNVSIAAGVVRAFAYGLSQTQTPASGQKIETSPKTTPNVKIASSLVNVMRSAVASGVKPSTQPGPSRMQTILNRLKRLRAKPNKTPEETIEEQQLEHEAATPPAAVNTGKIADAIAAAIKQVVNSLPATFGPAKPYTGPSTLEQGFRKVFGNGRPRQKVTKNAAVQAVKTVLEKQTGTNVSTSTATQVVNAAQNGIVPGPQGPQLSSGAKNKVNKIVQTNLPNAAANQLALAIVPYVQGAQGGPAPPPQPRPRPAVTFSPNTNFRVRPRPQRRPQLPGQTPAATTPAATTPGRRFTFTGRPIAQGFERVFGTGRPTGRPIAQGFERVFGTGRPSGRPIAQGFERVFGTGRPFAGMRRPAQQTPTPGKQNQAQQTPTPGKQNQAQQTPTPGQQNQAQQTPTPGQQNQGQQTQLPGVPPTPPLPPNVRNNINKFFNSQNSAALDGLLRNAFTKSNGERIAIYRRFLSNPKLKPEFRARILDIIRKDFKDSMDRVDDWGNRTQTNPLVRKIGMYRQIKNKNVNTIANRVDQLLKQKIGVTYTPRTGFSYGGPSFGGFGGFPYYGSRENQEIEKYLRAMGGFGTTGAFRPSRIGGTSSMNSALRAALSGARGGSTNTNAALRAALLGARGGSTNTLPPRLPPPTPTQQMYNRINKSLTPNERSVVQNVGGVASVNKIFKEAGGAVKVGEAAQVLKQFPRNQAVSMGLATPKAVSAVARLGGPNKAAPALVVYEKIEKAKMRKSPKKKKKAATPATKPQIKVALLKKMVNKFTKNELVKLAGENTLKSKNHKKETLVKNFTKFIRKQPKKKRFSSTVKGKGSKKK